MDASQSRSNVFFRRVAIVTGGSSGIGAALAVGLVARGARVIIADVNFDRASALAETLGPAARAVALDVRDASAFAAVVDRTISEDGAIDYLFNNAGILSVGEIRDIDSANWRNVFETNFFGAVHGILPTYAAMVARGQGHIVNIASQSGLLPSPLYAPYASSKAAIVALTNALRLEARELGISVTLVCPGNVATRIFDESERLRIARMDVFKDSNLGMLDPIVAAERILKDVAKCRSFVIFPFSARMMWYAYRIWPATLDFLMREVIRRFRRARITAELALDRDVSRATDAIVLRQP